MATQTHLGLHSFRISVESFTTLRCPLFLKQKTGKELLLGSTIHTNDFNYLADVQYIFDKLWSTVQRPYRPLCAAGRGPAYRPGS